MFRIYGYLRTICLKYILAKSSGDLSFNLMPNTVLNKIRNPFDFRSSSRLQVYIQWHSIKCSSLVGQHCIFANAFHIRTIYIYIYRHRHRLQKRSIWCTYSIKIETFIVVQLNQFRCRPNAKYNDYSHCFARVYYIKQYIVQ